MRGQRAQGMWHPQLPKASHFLSTSLWRFVSWFTGMGHRCGFLDAYSSAALRVLVPNTSELGHINNWDETHICSVVKLLPLMFWVKVFFFLLTLCLFFLLISDQWNQAKTLVFQNKYPDWMPDKLHMVCIIVLFAWELAKKPAEVRAAPHSLALNTGAVCSIWCVFLSLDFVSFPGFPSWFVMSFPRCEGADGNLFSPSEMTPWIVANISRKEASEPTWSVILHPEDSLVFQWGQK